MDKSGAGEMKSRSAPSLSEGTAGEIWGGTERVNKRCRVKGGKMDGGRVTEGRK